MIIAPALGASSMPDAWYAALQKLSWNPRGWLFGPVWSVLYTMMVVSAWLVWQRGGFSLQRASLTLFLVPLALNAAWTPLFFGIPHLPARDKRVIFLFMWGGPSHMDMFDPKPRLNTEAGKDLPGATVGSKKDNLGKLIGSPFTFRQHGQGGIWMNDLLPHLSRQAERMCVVRPMHTEGNAHGEALLRLHTGQANLVRPSVRSWVSYGLGRGNDNLPAFITISPPRGHGGVQNYGNSFFPRTTRAWPLAPPKPPSPRP